MELGWAIGRFLMGLCFEWGDCRSLRTCLCLFLLDDAHAFMRFDNAMTSGRTYIVTL